MSNAGIAGPYLASKQDLATLVGRKTASLTLENAYASLCLILLLNFAKNNTPCLIAPNDTLSHMA